MSRKLFGALNVLSTVPLALSRSILKLGLAGGGNPGKIVGAVTTKILPSAKILIVLIDSPEAEKLVWKDVKSTFPAGIIRAMLTRLTELTVSNLPPIMMLPSARMSKSLKVYETVLPPLLAKVGDSKVVSSEPSEL